jgi:hypothetical protein
MSVEWKNAHQSCTYFIHVAFVCCSLWVIVNGTKAAELTTSRKVTVTVTYNIGEMNGVENR